MDEVLEGCSGSIRGHLGVKSRSKKSPAEQKYALEVRNQLWVARDSNPEPTD